MRVGPALLATALIALASATDSPVRAQSADPPIAYVVKPGDNLFTLGGAYLLHPSDYRLVQKANHVADPRRLRVGSTILFDPALLKSAPTDAHVSAVSGRVTITAGGQSARATVGMAISEGQIIATGPGSFVTFELADDSRITLPSVSTVRIVRLRAIALTDAVQRVFAVDEGRADIAASHSGNPNSRFEVRTPLSVSAVRGTEFRVSQDGASRRAATEVVQGGVGVSAGAAEVLVPLNFGLSATPAGLGRLTPLLPAPQLIRGGRDQEEPDVAFQAQPLAGAQTYRVQIANDAGFVDIIAEATSADGAFAFHDLPNGTYFARVTAIDPGGIEGLAGAYSFQRDLNTLDPGQPPKGEAIGGMRRFLFRWGATGDGVRTYRFQLYAGADQAHAIVDLPGLTQPQVTVTDLPTGAYAWRVTAIRFKDGRFSEKTGGLQTLRIGE